MIAQNQVVVTTALVVQNQELITVRKGTSGYSMMLDTDNLQVSPEVLARAKEPIDTASEVQKAKGVKRMAEEMRQVNAAAALNPAQVKELEEAANKAISQSVEAWSARVGPLLAMVHQNVSGLPPAAVKDVLRSSSATTERAGEVPWQHPVWTAALQSVLTPEQLSAWKQADEDRRPQWVAQTMARIQPMVTKQLDSLWKPLEDRLSVVKRDLTMPADRATGLKEQALSLAKGEIAAWEGRIKEVVTADPAPDVDEAAATARLRRARVKAPSETDLWADIRRKLLTSGEQEQVDALATTRAARRKDAEARLALAELDRSVAFTAEQRAALLPIALRLLPQRAEIDNSPMMVSTQPLRGMANATEADLKPILDDVQRTRWHNACQPTMQTSATPPAPSSVVDEDADEQEISDFFFQRTEQAKSVEIQNMLVKVDDAARVIPLPPARTRPLEMAARGAVENVFARFRGAMEESARPQIRPFAGQDPRSRRNELASTGTMTPYGSFYSAEEMPMWKNALQTLGPAEQEKWRREVAQRAAFRQEAAAKAALTEFDRVVVLSDAQWQRLEAPMLKVLQEYLPDLENNFHANFGMNWLRDYYRRYIPVAAIEADVKATLETEQWGRWMDVGRAEQCRLYWQQTKLQHDERVKSQAQPPPP